MYKPQIRRKKSGIPVLSKDEIDDIAENLLADYNPEWIKHPQEIDIDLFAQEYLKADQDFQYLSHNGIYLGMTVFNDSDRVVVFNPEKGQADYVSEKARTIIIDTGLLERGQEHRYRFTMGHECGHLYLHPQYFTIDPNQMTLDMFMDMGPQKPSFIVCREDMYKLGAKSKVWDDRNTLEWQANYFSAAILMPHSMVAELYRQERMMYGRDPRMIHRLADEIEKVFNVSHESSVYRLQDLGYTEAGCLVGDRALDSQIEWGMEQGLI
ncbi:MAG: ImmA/IrrE family metallo-endopeptidase [Lachnospiraceae bacterium]|jgi:Zn-dependent peptidase ImmA (M78 family)|nr:ImmA/IrrE family metallo-endopeptidase [Lachnospiraceae bacterium]